MNFFRRILSLFKQRGALNRNHEHALIDIETKIVLIVSTDLQLIMSLHEMIDSTVYIPDVDLLISQDTIPRLNINCTQYPEWTWKTKLPIAFVRTPQSRITKELLEKSDLASSKLQALRKITYLINLERSKIVPNIICGQFVYLAKKEQAQKFKASGFENIQDFPYVEQYAEYANLTAEQAANEILFKAQISDDTLVKTESFRLRYFDLLRKARTTEDVLLLEANNREPLFLMRNLPY